VVSACPREGLQVAAACVCDIHQNYADFLVTIVLAEVSGIVEQHRQIVYPPWKPA